MPRIRSPHRFRKPVIFGVAGVLVAGALVAGLQSAYAGTENNLALGKTITGSQPCNGKEVPASAVNGSTGKGLSDKWCSGVPHATLKLDLGAAVTLGKLVVKHAGAGGESKSWNTRDFTLQVSLDGQKFTTVSEARNNHADVTVHPITPVNARYVLLTVNVPTSSPNLRAARIYELEAYAADKPVPTAPPTTAPTTKPTTAPPTTAPTTKPAPTTTAPPAPAACHSDAPEKLTDYVAEHTSAMTRVSCNSDIALYMDQNLLGEPKTKTNWVTPFATDVWKYFKATYGGCVVPRKTSAAEGGCAKFGAPKPALVFAHKDSYSGGTVVGRFDSRGKFRTTVDVGYGNWDEKDNQLRDIIVHEFCHQVEGDSQGTNGSPAFGLWGDSKWAEYCLVDFYANTGRKADADRLISEFSTHRDNMPQGASNAAWFKDWFLPLWHDGGDTASVMNKYFELLAKNFPTSDANNGANLQYSRGLNIGEYVLFSSAAAGKDLSGRAKTAFNSGWKQNEFDQAKKDFPNLKF